MATSKPLITNTPENIKKNEVKTCTDIPILFLIPFSSPPIVTFKDIVIGENATRTLTISNPKTTTGRLTIHKRYKEQDLNFSWDENIIPPNQSILLNISWSPKIEQSYQKTIEIHNKREKYNVIIICETVSKKNKKSTFKMKMKTSRNTTGSFNLNYINSVKNTNYENLFNKSTYQEPYNFIKSDILNYNQFNSDQINRRDTYLINKKTDNEDILYQRTPVKRKYSTLSPTNTLILSAIENLQFTPTSIHQKQDMNNFNEKDTKYVSQDNKKSAQKKKIFSLDNTTSPVSNISGINKLPSNFGFTLPNMKILEKDDFEINENFTENHNYLVDISINNTNTIINCDEEFNPDRCSTEKKCNNRNPFYNMNFNNKENNISLDNTYSKLSFETYTKGDSPIIPLNTGGNQRLHSSPYSVEKSPQNLLIAFSNIGPIANEDNLKTFNEKNIAVSAAKERNDSTNIKSIIEANLWQKSSVRSISPTPLFTITEEPSTICLESTYNIHKKPHFDTIILNKTYDKNKNISTSCNNKNGWNKTASNKHFNEKTLQELNIHNSELLANNINIYAMANIVDPFLSPSFLYDEEVYKQLEIEFKRWLNYLLTPPSDLDTKLDIDIAKVWLENRNKAIPTAPTREKVSMQYHTSHRLESLRKSAKTLIGSNKMTKVFINISNQVNKKILVVRTDKNLHLDIGLQKTILNILLCYNPLWLRIGLEAIYNTVIPMSSNDDICGLSDFIIENMFKNPKLSPKHYLIIPTYADNMKKFTLKQFLYLVYFLDQAKEQKIIPHDPCLFCRNAYIKESKQILYNFVKEMLSGIGDIIKHLRPTGYSVNNKQTYIDEFKYGVNNLATDLKDGVRLVRLMEIILMKENLTKSLRTPAISRIQKIHNVQIALNALSSMNFNITGNIEAKDIVDGHREKTLSLLWQIINKFRAPLFDNAATIIQKWWRHKYLYVWVKNKILKRKQEQFNKAAITIQSKWRGYSCRKIVEIKKTKEIGAIIIIQKYWKMWKYKSEYNKLKLSVIKIQKWYKNIMFQNVNVDRFSFLLQKHASIKIQQFYRAYKKVKSERERFLIKRTSIIKIQRFYKSWLLTKKSQKEYAQLKFAVKIIQNKFRAKMAMREAQNKYLVKRNAVCTIQSYFRYYREMKKTQHNYLQIRNAAIMIQRKYKAYILMRDIRKEYLVQKTAIIYIQKYYRNYKLMKIEQNHYIQIKYAIVTIQCQFRANISMKYERNKFITTRTAVITLQRYYRNYLIMKKIRQHYLRLKNITKLVQRRFRANILMKSVRNQYLQRKNAAVIIQRYYTNYHMMKITQTNYLKLRKAAVIIQMRYKANKLMLKQQKEYLDLKNAAVVLQKHYHSLLLMKIARQNYLKLQKAAIIIQRRYQANVFMKILRDRFLKQKNAAMIIQKYYKNYQMMKKIQTNYLKLRNAVIVIQTKYKFNKLMLKQQNKYLTLRNAAISIQMHFRSYLLMKTAHQNYMNLRKAANTLQTKYRAKVSMEIVHKKYLKQKNATIIIQKYYKNYQKMKEIRIDYLKLKNAVVVIQTKYRLRKLMIEQQNKYLMQRNAAILLQKHFRNYLMMKKTRQTYLNLRKMARIIQMRYRANVLMKTTHAQYIKQRNATIIIQKFYKNYQIMKKIRINYLKLRTVTMTIQIRYKSNKLMLTQRNKYLDMRKAAILLQKYYHNYLLMKNTHQNYLNLKKAINVIQVRYRANTLMKFECKKYLKQKNAVVVIQRYYRNYQMMKKERTNYSKLKTSTIVIQNIYRSNKLMLKQRNKYLTERKATISIQKYYRNYLLMRNTRQNYLYLKKATRIIQIRYRANVLMKTTNAQFLKQKNATIIIQKYYKNYQIMKKIRLNYLEIRNATKIIQDRYKANKLMMQQRCKYLTQRDATIVLQKHYHNYLLMKNTRQNYLNLKKAVNTIQARYRANVTMKIIHDLYLKQKNAALIIQRYFRNYLMMKEIRSNYLKLRNATVSIQTIYRFNKLMIKERNKYLAQKNAAVILQKYYRNYVLMKNTHQNFLTLRKIAITIQTQYRAKILMKKVHGQYLKMKYAAIVIQKYYRFYLKMKSIRNTHLKQKETEAKKLFTAATKIQSIWRGYIIRREQKDNSNVKMLRLKWKNGGLLSRQQTLTELKDDALIVLSHFKDIASVIVAFKNLDTITKIYPMIYSAEEVVYIARGLIMYMNATNRSISVLETLYPGIAILINLTKYQPTARFAFSVKYLNTLLSLMMRWSNNDTLICSLCTLLWLYSKYEDIKTEVSLYLRENEAYKMLCKIHNLVLREKKMKNRKRYSKNQSFSIKNKIIYPATELDFGFLNMKKPTMFQDELHAIESLFIEYNLPLYNTVEK